MNSSFAQQVYTGVATCGGIGYLPYAPGTAASALTMALLYASSFSEQSWITQLLCIFLITLVALLSIRMMETVHTSATKDPSYIVIDEVVGSCVTFFCVPLSGYFLLAGFILFRFFDIYKPCGVVFLEQLPGAFGVVCDDILAGLYALLMLQLGSYFLL